MFFSSLDKAAYKGDERELRQLLNKGKYVNQPASGASKNGRTPIHAAALSGNARVVEFLLENGADVNSLDLNGETALHYAAKTNYVPVLNALLQGGIDYSIRSREGKLAIHSMRDVSMQEELRKHLIESSIQFNYFDINVWKPFTESASNVLKFELGDGSDFAVLTTPDGSNYIIDFVRHLQVNASSLIMRSVRWRIPPHGTWHADPKPYQGIHPGSQDTNYLLPYQPAISQLRSQSHFPPNPDFYPPSDDFQFENHASTSSGLGNSMPGSSSYGGKAEFYTQPSSSRDIIHSRAPSAPPLEHLSSLSQSMGGGFVAFHPSLFCFLRSGSSEYNEISARFINGMQKKSKSFFSKSSSIAQQPRDLRPVTVTAVHRVINPSERVKAFGLALTKLKQVRGHTNERTGWHGSPLESLHGIVMEGFKLLSAPHNGRLFGHGVYLSSDPCAFMSAEFAVPDESGEKHILFCRLALGNLEVVRFESAQNRPISDRYDTGTDSLRAPTRYIVWEEDAKNYILPTHVISFRYY